MRELISASWNCAEKNAGVNVKLNSREIAELYQEKRRSSRVKPRVKKQKIGRVKTGVKKQRSSRVKSGVKSREVAELNQE
jgi:hypothetical protein